MSGFFANISNFFKKDEWRVALFIILIFLSIFSVVVLKPKIIGDSVSYVDSMNVLSGGIIPQDFTPYRIVTSYLGLKLILVINTFVGNLPLSWLILNGILYIAIGMFFYELLKK